MSPTRGTSGATQPKPLIALWTVVLLALAVAVAAWPMVAL